MKSALLPVLVFGPRKSGTTLLHNLLDGGGELVMIPGELKLQRIIKGFEVAPRDLARHYLHHGRLDFEALIMWQNGQPQASDHFSFAGLNHEQMRESFDSTGYVAQLSEMLSHPPREELNVTQVRDLIERDVSAFLQSVKRLPPGLKFLASKEISNKPEVALTFWRELFPDGRIVYLVRQPEFIVRSILNDRRRKKMRLSMHRIWLHCIEAQHLVNFAYEASFWPLEKRPVFLSYEAMTASPETVMRRVAGELGITFEPILAKPTTLGVPMVVRTSSRSTTEIFQQETSWKNGLTQRELRVVQTFGTLKELVFRRRGETLVSYAQMQERFHELGAA